uniref:Uncharacterized protein n=1 Tax=Parascaris univalens TaxID=6257 RepID=A0A914ZEW3_PARUN
FLLHYCFVYFMERNRLDDWSIRRMMSLREAVRFICSSTSASSAADAWFWRGLRLMGVMVLGVYVEKVASWMHESLLRLSIPQVCSHPLSAVFRTERCIGYR